MKQVVVLMALFYLVQSFAGNPGIADLRLTLYLKETLNLSAGEWANFQGIVSVPWIVKPLWGIIADSFSLFGYSIKSYFLICYSLVLFVFLGLSQVRSPTISMLLVGVISVTTCIAFSDVLADRLMVVAGKARRQTAVLQAAQWAAFGFGDAIMYYLSGWIAKHCTLSVAFSLNAIVPFVGLIGTLFLLNERELQIETISAKRSLTTLWATVTSRRFFAILCFIAFLGFSPTPPLFFYRRDVLEFSEDFLGILGAVGSLALGLGAIAFGVVASRIPRQVLLKLVVGLSTISTLSLLWMSDESSAVLVELFRNFTGTIAILGVLEMAANACPVGAEGTTYAVLMSGLNFAASLGAVLGGSLYDGGLSFANLVIISALSTGLCWFLIPLLRLDVSKN